MKARFGLDFISYSTIQCVSSVYFSLLLTTYWSNVFFAYYRLLQDSWNIGFQTSCLTTHYLLIWYLSLLEQSTPTGEHRSESIFPFIHTNYAIMHILFFSRMTLQNVFCGFFYNGHFWKSPHLKALTIW